MRNESTHPQRGGKPSPRPLRRPVSPLPRLAAATLALLLGTLAAGPVTAQGPGQPKTPQPPPPGTPQPPPTSERATGIRYSGRMMIGDACQTFELSAADGSTFRLQSLRDKEAATLMFLQKAENYLEGYAVAGDSLAAHGIRLVFVCQQRPSKSLQRTWPGMVIVHDRQGDVARIYGALNVVTEDTVPSLYLVDREGKLRYYAVGRLPTPSELEAISVAVLEEVPEE